ncbi:hypothetical protein DSM106972_045030 [Dulcicalothrix desertica PCC 7102]|uniref:Uncharacterized protein n=1 Tax=Dulcicalothrix desertica PCC 7102 TaxID=232991 RepID=A0A3S1CK06_9CYAN|nr:hypothetical protein [Dulcicalothrix desertica]RUT04275.1 hypothetical protein DSM106972_045030 [Dulcicalothrix desertica PCC 7102]TWH38837.1 hypothetical protein CAL7102_08024 [Dulcicalothrix desertica PCC 7102]
MTLPYTNNTTEAIVLQALRKALDQLNSLIPDSLKLEIEQQLSQILANPNSSSVENLIKLVKDYPDIYNEYRTCRKNIFRDYQAQERNKGFYPKDKDIQPTTAPIIIDNFIAPTPTINEVFIKVKEQVEKDTQSPNNQ